MLLFFNVDFPSNLESFLKIFKVVAMGFVPNPIDWFYKDDTKIITPPRFMDNGYTGSFLLNSGNILFVFMILGLINLILWSMKKVNKSGTMSKIIDSIQKRVGSSLIFQLFVSMTPVLLISCVL